MPGGPTPPSVVPQSTESVLWTPSFGKSCEVAFHEKGGLERHDHLVGAGSQFLVNEMMPGAGLELEADVQTVRQPSRSSSPARTGDLPAKSARTGRTMPQQLSSVVSRRISTGPVCECGDEAAVDCSCPVPAGSMWKRLGIELQEKGPSPALRHLGRPGHDPSPDGPVVRTGLSRPPRRFQIHLLPLPAAWTTVLAP